MTNEEIKEAREKAWTEIWYLSRWLVGGLIHIFMIFCAFALTEQVVEVSRMIPEHRDAFQTLSPLMQDIIVAIPSFAAGMAGAHWIKGIYIRYCLPEVMDDVTKKILKS